jgi:hypothetical protein
MIILGLPVVIVIGFILWFVYDEGGYWSSAEQKWHNDASWALWCLGLLVGLSLFFTGVAINKGSHYKVVPPHTRAEWDIFSSGDTTGVSGHFVLGSGSMNEDPIYAYYYPVGPHSYKQGWVYADYSTIVEDAKPGHAYIRQTGSNGKWEFWGFRHGTNDHYDIHVPKGSVIQQHVYDLEK